jgi:hypothetical protein
LKEAIHGLKIGLSIGIFEAGKDNVSNVLIEADKELYRCKSMRKNPKELTSEDQMRSYLWHSLSEEE